MIVKGWNNGSQNNSTGAGYGIVIRKVDRDLFFQRKWKEVSIEFEEGPPLKLKISKSFWKSCIELRSKFLGQWMLNNGSAPWPENEPPVFNLEPIENKVFRLR